MTLLLVALLLIVSEPMGLWGQFALSNIVLSETKEKLLKCGTFMTAPPPLSYLHSDSPGCYGSVRPISNHTSRGPRGFRQWRMNAYSLVNKTKYTLRFEKKMPIYMLVEFA